MLRLLFNVFFLASSLISCQYTNQQSEQQYQYPQTNPSYNSPYGPNSQGLYMPSQNPTGYNLPYNTAMNPIAMDSNQISGQNYTTNPTQSSYTYSTNNPQNDQVCDIEFQRKIERCGEELVSLGVVRQSASFLQQLLPAIVRMESRDQLVTICNARQHFKECIGNLDQDLENKFCFSHGAISAPFALANAELSYTCNDGYDVSYMSWGCYQLALSKPEVQSCQNSVSQRVQQFIQNERSQDENICNAIKFYIDCVRGPMLNECGDRALHTFIKTIEKGLQAQIPFCTVSGSSSLSISILLLLPLILNFIYYNLLN